MGPEIHQLTSQPQWTYCEIPRDAGVKNGKEEGEMIIILCASCGLHRGDRVSTSGRWHQPSGVPTANHNLHKGQIFVKGKTAWHIFLFKPQPPQLTTEDVHNWEVKSTQRGDKS